MKHKHLIYLHNLLSVSLSIAPPLGGEGLMFILFMAVSHVPKIVPGIRWILSKHLLELN